MTILVQQQTTEADRKQLRELCDKAKWTGRWYDGGCNTVMCDYDNPDPMQHDELAHPCPVGGVVEYLVGVQPAAVLSLLDEIERLKAALQEERQMRARIGRAANWLCGYAEGRNSFSRIKEINDAIQEVPDGH